MADALVSASVPVFGPGRAAAGWRSKVFAKEVMARAGVATAASASFRDADAALAYARRQDQPPVVKADGLAGGKGVVVPDSLEEAEAAINAQLAGPASEGGVVLEERLVGREVSAFALVSGEAVVPLASACDYKRLGDGDSGLNTGGMGRTAPCRGSPRASWKTLWPRCSNRSPWRLARDGTPYRGVLYAGMILTAGGPWCWSSTRASATRRRRSSYRSWTASWPMPCWAWPAAIEPDGRVGGVAAGAAVGVVLASEGYPEAPHGRPLTGADPAGPDDDGPPCFHAATRRADAGVATTGGRVATVGLGRPGRGAPRRTLIEAASLEVAQLAP